MESKSKRKEDKQDCDDIDVVVGSRSHSYTKNRNQMPNVYGGFVFDFSLLHNSRYIEKSVLGFAENIVRTGAI